MEVIRLSAGETSPSDKAGISVLSSCYKTDWPTATGGGGGGGDGGSLGQYSQRMETREREASPENLGFEGVGILTVSLERNSGVFVHFT